MKANNRQVLKRLFLGFMAVTFITVSLAAREQIPLPEHPRPDFERADWINLNGTWNFTFDEAIAKNAVEQNRMNGFDLKIQVPFGWGSKLSGVENKADKGYYGRSATIPESWKGKRIYLIVGASEWETKAWINGTLLGEHQGGYTPFEFELTEYIEFGKPQNIFISADDTPANRLDGKQGYGNVRGIWQTVYLEARGNNFFECVHYSPDVGRSVVKVEAMLKNTPAANSQIQIRFKNGEQETFVYNPKGKLKNQQKHTFEIKLTDQQLWDLDNPYLYEMEVSLVENKIPVDIVDTYFGQRKIGVVHLPGTDYPYVALNDKPVYMQLCLDQSYHPDGFYTFPSDKFMRDEILLSKKLGLNGNRIHIKVEIPRKLYWADKLGLLIMADVPNWWGEPDDNAKKDWHYCMINQIKRDYNHPSIFSWVDFNETWGLFTDMGEERKYLPETQEWVREMYLETKKQDPTRLVEDNSPCNNDHVQTDINTWHAYLLGYEWKNFLDNKDAQTYPGSTDNYINGNKQVDIPMFNSECGNVWGYEGSTNDVDYTWDYHLMINEFRSHPKCAGWLYTEHHDVINEWNGYVRFDRSPKIDGLSAFVPDMTMADFHSAYYIAPQGLLCKEAKAGSTVEVPLFASFMTDRNPGSLVLETNLIGWDVLGHEIPRKAIRNIPVNFKPYLNELITSATVTLPQESGLYCLQFELKNGEGQVLSRNFTLFHIKDGIRPDSNGKMNIVSFPANEFTDAKWSLKQWDVLGGLKVNGAGNGYFEYEIPWPQGVRKKDLQSVSFVVEASAKELFGKDMDDVYTNVDYMRGAGAEDPRKSQNAYAMSDQEMFPSMVKIIINGVSCGDTYLPDDPADHRGVLSWFAQPQNRKLSEAGSYGYPVERIVPVEALTEGQPIKIRMEVTEGVDGGLAIYGKNFGRYPMDPTLVFVKTE